jgi:hypothetical protein
VTTPPRIASNSASLSLCSSPVKWGGGENEMRNRKKHMQYPWHRKDIITILIASVSPGIDTLSKNLLFNRSKADPQLIAPENPE